MPSMNERHVIGVRTAEREGADGVYFCIYRPPGLREFILHRDVLEVMTGRGLSTQESLLKAFDAYRDPIARTADATAQRSFRCPTILTLQDFPAPGLDLH
ncbi:MAG TPA: hypothetical protein VLJ57_10810 [Burkholderiaceae bacterium]|nr:hypothetical protein [Burkholderiaceae bacterium]